VFLCPLPHQLQSPPGIVAGSPCEPPKRLARLRGRRRWRIPVCRSGSSHGHAIVATGAEEVRTGAAAGAGDDRAGAEAQSAGALITYQRFQIKVHLISSVNFGLSCINNTSTLSSPRILPRPVLVLNCDTSGTQSGKLSPGLNSSTRNRRIHPLYTIVSKVVLVAVAFANVSSIW